MNLNPDNSHHFIPFIFIHELLLYPDPHTTFSPSPSLNNRKQQLHHPKNLFLLLISIFIFKSEPKPMTHNQKEKEDQRNPHPCQSSTNPDTDQYPYPAIGITVASHTKPRDHHILRRVIFTLPWSLLDLALYYCSISLLLPFRSQFGLSLSRKPT